MAYSMDFIRRAVEYKLEGIPLTSYVRHLIYILKHTTNGKKSFETVIIKQNPNGNEGER